MKNRTAFPSNTAWVTPRTNLGQITTDNCKIILNQNIDNLGRVLVNADSDDFYFRFTSDGNTTQRVEFANIYSDKACTNRIFNPVDVSKYVVEAAKYSTLNKISVWQGTLPSDGGLYLANTWYYTHTGNEIILPNDVYSISQNTPELILVWSLFDLFNKYNKIYFKVYDDGSDPYEFTKTSLELANVQASAPTLTKWQFRVYYTPLGESVKLKSVKVNPQPQDFAIPFSQQQPIVNNTTMGKEMQSIANRSGCETKQVVRVIPSMRHYRAPGAVYYEKDENGNKTGNVWRLTRCEISIYSDTYIKVVETWSKNWTYRSPNVPINREFRSWDIPADIVQRNLHYNDYCIFARGTSLLGVLPDNALISPVGRETIMRKLTNQTDIRREMSNVWFLRENNPEIGAVMTCSAFGFGTSLAFACRTKDNLSAGVQRVKADSNDKDYMFCKDVYYCDDDGKLEYMWIQISDQISPGDPNAYPECHNGTVGNVPTGNMLFRTTGELRTNKFHIQKDPSEQLNFVYQLHFLSADGLLVIGTAWAALNELVKTPETPNQIKVWGLTKHIPNGLPVMVTDYGEVVTDQELFSADMLTGKNPRIRLHFNPQTYVGVCVTDEKNNVLVAYNNNSVAVYYGTFTHDYEDIYNALFETSK